MKPLPLVISSFLTLSLCQTMQGDRAATTLRIETDTVLQQADPHKLVGTNVSLWSRRHAVEDAQMQADIRDWQPALIRMPGGSWSNEYYWNGNGVRIGDDHGPENFDASKQKPDGTWEVDYSNYKPGFRLHAEERHLSDYHGDIDVKFQHEWINNLDSSAMVTVNVGSGTPEVAAEWVKWANHQQGYGVRYWEVGNELNGDWELGHRLPDGRSMTGEDYARIFTQFAKEMHAVDPSIKLGGPACSDLALDFVEELIRDGGDELDFVSIHAYPVGVNTQDTAKKFAQIDDMREAARKIHGWIDQYQPDRKDEIEIGVTEWNLKVNEDRDTVDLINGLWSAIWIGTLFEEGIDFANQWDLLTYTPEGGHSAFFSDHPNKRYIRKSQYWALWMWSNLMGNELLETSCVGCDSISKFVTRNKNGLQVMLINTSETNDATVKLEIPGAERPSSSGVLHTFSRSEYFWDPHARRVLWSEAPTQTAVDLAAEPTLNIPAFSVCVLQLPWQDGTALQAQPVAKQRDFQLQLLLPERYPADREIEAWVVATDASGEKPFSGTLPKVQLAIEGSGKLDTTELTLEHASARFTITPEAAEKLSIKARGGNIATSRAIDLIALKERTDVYWTFDNPIDEWNAKSTYTLGSESSIRPNQYVAAARLKAATTAQNADLLFHFEPMPAHIPLENASGVIGKLRASHDLTTDDPNAKVNIILQSDANHWMPIGSFQLANLIGQWERFEFKFEDPKLLDAMHKLYAIRFQLQAEAPVTGEIYLDDLGFVSRTGL